MENRIEKTELVSWKEINDLQPSNAKVIENDEALRESILKFGFATPFFVWQDPKSKEIYAIDGHSRKRVLLGMDNVPEKLPATFIHAKDKTEAMKLLIEVYNQKQNKFNKTSLDGIIKDFGFTDINLKTIDFKPAAYEFVPGMNTSTESEQETVKESSIKTNTPKKTDDDYASFEMVLPYNDKLELVRVINEIQKSQGFENKYQSLTYLVNYYKTNQTNEQ